MFDFKVPKSVAYQEAIMHARLVVEARKVFGAAAHEPLIELTSKAVLGRDIIADKPQRAFALA